MESTMSEMGLQVGLLGAGVLLIWVAQLFNPEPKRIRIRADRGRRERRR